MQGEKWFLKSKTVAGVIIAALPTLLPVLGLSYGAEDHTLVSGLVDQLFVAIGSALALYGRFSAKDSLRVKP